MGKDVKRLYGQFMPEHYELRLNLDKPAQVFSGRVTIRGRKGGRPSQRLTFHQNGLQITSASIVRADRKGEQYLSVDRINHHAKFDEVRLHSKQMLYPGEYTVCLEFKGRITRPMNGIYPCFFDHSGQAKQLLASQFESHHAREAFPCIDEPEAKATFQLILGTAADDVVVSNTPVASVDKAEPPYTGGKWTTFEVTPKMSTYLLAFVAGELGYKEAKTKDGVVVRTYATPDNVKHTEFALQTAVRILEFYNDYFDVAYPLPKCDLIGLPDFAAGAMENWGCITFREQCFLVDPKNTSLPTKQYVAMVVAHELAHQWFGNLVTMRWWTDLWLNEGFASWIEYLAVDKLFPEWNMWTQFVVDEQQPALKLDALENTHPIEVAVHHPDEIRTIFDNISYSKGASVIHMLHSYLGPTDFQKGLSHYLKKHAYGNTDTVDLWSALETASHKPVRKFMHSWTTQPGYPIVSANFKPGAKPAHSKHVVELELKQHRFSYTQANHTQRWPIPINGQRALKDSVFDQTHMSISLEGPNPNYWLNTNRTGFYQVIYDSDHVQRLAELVLAGKLPPTDRLGILADMYDGAKAGYTTSRAMLNLLRAYAQEDNAAVWDVMAGVLGGVRAAMDDEDLRDAMKPFTRQLVARQLKKLGWQAKKGEPHFDSLLRPTILSLASVAEEPAVVQECRRQFQAMTRPEDIEPDVRSVIYGTAARTGNAKTFAKLLRIYNNCSSSEERTLLAAALTGFKQPDLIKQALGLIDSPQVRLQDISYWIAYSFMNRHAKHATWQWLTTHWDWLEQNIGSDMSFNRLPLYAARCFSDAKFIPVYQKFFSSVMTPALQRTYKQGLEVIEWQAAWKKRDLVDIKAFFAHQD